MVQIAMLITAVAVGLKAPSINRALTILIVVFGVTIVPQTILVASDDGAGTASDLAIYTVVQVLSLGLAVLIARTLYRRRQATATA